jgi:Bacterial RNA polymerase, alpha chain C terminal domain/Mrr N-terminal domain
MHPIRNRKIDHCWALRLKTISRIEVTEYFQRGLDTPSATLLQGELVTRETAMMPVIRISDATYARLQSHAKPFEDSPESIIIKALTALDMMTGESPVLAEPKKRSDSPKLPQKEFRVPLLMTLLRLGGSAPAKNVRSVMETLMAPRLKEGDYESVSTGDPRWWNAVCWERSDLVKEGFISDDSDRGIWEISDAGKRLPATLHREEKGTDRVVSQGTLEEVARTYRGHSLVRHSYFVMVGDVVFKESAPPNPILFKRVDALELSVRSATCLKNDNITYIGDLVHKTVDEIFRIPNFGRRSVNEISELLKSMGLSLGMELPDWPPEDIEALAARFEADSIE